jgi:hypothetical protein
MSRRGRKPAKEGDTYAEFEKQHAKEQKELRDRRKSVIAEERAVKNGSHHRTVLIKMQHQQLKRERLRTGIDNRDPVQKAVDDQREAENAKRRRDRAALKSTPFHRFKVTFHMPTKDGTDEELVEALEAYPTADILTATWQLQDMPKPTRKYAHSHRPSNKLYRNQWRGYFVFNKPLTFDEIKDGGLLDGFDVKLSQPYKDVAPGPTAPARQEAFDTKMVKTVINTHKNSGPQRIWWYNPDTHKHEAVNRTDLVGEDEEEEEEESHHSSAAEEVEAAEERPAKRRPYHLVPYQFAPPGPGAPAPPPPDVPRGRPVYTTSVIPNVYQKPSLFTTTIIPNTLHVPGDDEDSDYSRSTGLGSMER